MESLLYDSGKTEISETQQPELKLDYGNEEEVKAFFDFRIKRLIAFKRRVIAGEVLSEGEKTEVLEVITKLRQGIFGAPQEIVLFFEDENLRKLEKPISPTPREELLRALQADAVDILGGGAKLDLSEGVPEEITRQLKELGWMDPEWTQRLMDRAKGNLDRGKEMGRQNSEKQTVELRGQVKELQEENAGLRKKMFELKGYLNDQGNEDMKKKEVAKKDEGKEISGEGLYSASAPILDGPPRRFDPLRNPTYDAAVDVINPDRLKNPNDLPELLKKRGFVFKRLLFPGEQLAGRNLDMLRNMSKGTGVSEDYYRGGTRREAERLAQAYNDEYKSHQLALNGHAAETLVIIGHGMDEQGNISLKDYRAQVFQEKVKLTGEWLGIELNSENIRKIRGRSISELVSERDPELVNVAGVLREHQAAINSLQQAFMQSILLGLIPDLVRANSKDRMSVRDCGMLLNPNSGLNDKGELVFFDFGTPRADVLDYWQRQQLFKLMIEKADAENPELPVIITDELDEDGNPNVRKVKIAEWYKQALEEELKRSKKRDDSLVDINKDNYLGFITTALEQTYRYNGGRLECDNKKYRSFPDWEMDGKLGDPEVIPRWVPANLAYEVDCLRLISDGWFGTIKRGDQEINTPSKYINNLRRDLLQEQSSVSKKELNLSELVTYADELPHLNIEILDKLVRSMFRQKDPKKEITADNQRVIDQEFKRWLESREFSKKEIVILSRLPTEIYNLREDFGEIPGKNEGPNIRWLEGKPSYKNPSSRAAKPYMRKLIKEVREMWEELTYKPGLIPEEVVKQIELRLLDFENRNETI